MTQGLLVVVIVLLASILMKPEPDQPTPFDYGGQLDAIQQELIAICGRLPAPSQAVNAFDIPACQ